MIKVLSVLPVQDTGMKYYRQVSPHIGLNRTRPNEFIITGINENDFLNHPAEVFAQFDIIQLSRVDRYELSTKKNLSLLSLLHAKQSGATVILDIDDYWNLTKEHPAYNQYKQLGLQQDIKTGIALADIVTTTTETLAQHIRKINPNVHVLKNVIDPNDEQWKPRAITSPLVRFGWIGGVFHRPDVELMKASFKQVSRDKDLLKQIQLCGTFARNDEYVEIEKVFTNNYAALDESYKQYLFNFTPTAEHIGYFKPYRRLWAKDVYSYGDLYNQIDVALIPLVASPFNACKSELKLIEAAAMGKAVICSNTEPYQQYLAPKINCLSGNSGWYAAIKQLANDSELRAELAANLQKTVAEHFDPVAEFNKRGDLYTYVCKPKLIEHD